MLRLIWHKRRWRCKEQLCPRASFTESLPSVRARSRLTTRLRTELGCAVAEQGRVVSESAAHFGVDWSIVHAAFVEYVRAPLAAPLSPVKVLGIDETRRGRPVFAQDPDTVELIPGGAKTFLWLLCEGVGRDWTSGPSSIAVGPSPLLTEPVRVFSQL